jgi:uncharacterized protein (TIGR02147 family)
MKKDSIFGYIDYKSYIRDSFPIHGDSRGERTKLASFLGCRSAYISQVLNTGTHFSLEHAKLIDEYLHHKPDESRYFMTLMHLGRAGSKKLEEFYLKQLKEMRESKNKVSQRTKGALISESDQAIYYSAWYYSAIHLLVLIPKLRTLNALTEALRLPKKTVHNAVQFLISKGFLEVREDQYFATESRIHLNPDSPMLFKHHANWRLRAIENTELGDNNDIHYSGCIAVSQKNADLVRDKILNLIGELEPILSEPLEEVAFGICMDFFKIW